MTPSTTLTIPLEDEAATAALAARLAPLLRPRDMVALRGDLGAGKTAFARALVRFLSGDPEEEVPSPTFTLVQTYALPSLELWHFDLYRLTAPEEVMELGWEEVRAEACALVEWPDRLGSLLPADRLDITLRTTGPTSRVAELAGFGSWVERVRGLQE
ncbi:tRNA (adenosine(37)-N6)-threonylcarbamoyltransferase complex ATPase subunit type 1 TsaE [Aerophototrophica crusticola]|uniref:tRNA threonylcarbamoyladenosine biosynthesis protein TsaE n=1 Tax=Aerophototrophica crusticola TaxID=1709002 RepID=A0A858RAB3_9PROT|nr:tRNA (adenosine(37)-N6)-threonylcarbamoyltransferase complex ATPase subunit type 1 TsaE [Rhodospirillaceae bacterium B3]